ncbi:MAG: response regulator transcription factor [Labilithrix sp.]
MLKPRTMTATEEKLTVVLVEDDERLAQLTAKYLESHNVMVTIVNHGRDAVGKVAQVRPDVVLLDLMLPGMSGLDICRELRQRSDVPIVMVTARGEEADRVVGLEGGADDYIAKPFSSRELLARIRAHARRARGAVGPAKKALVVGRLSIDVDAMNVTLDGAPLALTTYEFMLLRALAERAGRVLSREQLVDLVRGSADEAFDRSIDVHISHLRNKLGDDPRAPRMIKTVRGVGYMLAPQET